VGKCDDRSQRPPACHQSGIGKKKQRNIPYLPVHVSFKEGERKDGAEAHPKIVLIHPQNSSILRFTLANVLTTRGPKSQKHQRSPMSNQRQYTKRRSPRMDSCFIRSGNKSSARRSVTMPSQDLADGICESASRKTVTRPHGPDWDIRRISQNGRNYQSSSSEGS